MRRTLALLVLSLALPSVAHAATARPPVQRVAAMPAATDGRSVAAFQDRDTIRTLGDDEPFGPGTVLPAPDPSCFLGGISATAYGFDCLERENYRRIWLRDRATGAVTRTPIAFSWVGANDEAFDLGALGTALAFIHESAGIHVDEGGTNRRLSDGAALVATPGSPHRIASLDAPTGSVPLCAPLAIGRHRESVIDDFFGTTSRELVRDDAVYRAPWLATVHHGRMLLKHCGSKRVRDLGPASENTEDGVQDTGRLVLTGRYVAWATPALRVHRLADHRTFGYGWLPLHSDTVLDGTDRRLWAQSAIDSTTNNTFMISP